MREIKSTTWLTYVKDRTTGDERGGAENYRGTPGEPAKRERKTVILCTKSMSSAHPSRGLWSSCDLYNIGIALYRARLHS